MFQFKRCLTLCFLACAALYQLAGADDVAVSQDFATYEEVKDLPNHPEKWLIDVRSRDMVEKDGAIPTSINIPFTELESALKLNDSEFKQKYGREKPPQDAIVIFSCLGGQYAQMGADMARSQGWPNAKPYLGSWMEWSRRESV